MLHQHELLEKIREIGENGDSGVLSLGHAGKIIVIYFREGLISAVSSNIHEHYLGQYMARHGYVQNGDLTRLLNDARRRQIQLGEEAVSKEVMDDSELVELVQQQAAKVLVYAMKHDFEVKAFTRSTPSSFYMPARISYSHLMLEMARNNLRPFNLNPNQLVALKNGKHLPPLPWYPQEISVLSELKEPKSVQELAASTGLEYVRLFKILSVFDTLKLVGVVAGPSSESTAVVKREGFPYEFLVPEIRRSGVSDKMETVREENSFSSEQFKTLKVRLSELAGTRPVQVITVSSAHTEEGKSLIAANLAASFSKDPGRQVIVIDCDMRNPSLHKYLGIGVDPGLMGYLEEDFLQPYCYMRRLDRMYILTAGGVARNPVELLSLEKMKSLIGYLRTEFNTIIIDSPPLGPISDAQILTGLSDGVVLVVRCGRSTYGRMEKAFKNFDRSKLLGVVLNDVQPLVFNTQYDYKYYRYYNRGHYPYGNPRIRPRRKNYLE